MLGFVVPLLLVACDAAGPLADTTGDSADLASEILLDLAVDGRLMPLNAAPARALSAAKEWEAQEDAACPSRSMDGLLLVLSGGCTTTSGVALSGTVRVDRVPDGGTWVFDRWREQDSGRDETWHGNLGWIRTDGVNLVTAYDFTWATAEFEMGYLSSVFTLTVDDRARTASGAVQAATAVGVATLALLGEWDFADCTTAPVAGKSTWTAGNTAVSASFDGVACGACIPWESGNDEGSWCFD